MRLALALAAALAVVAALAAPARADVDITLSPDGEALATELGLDPATLETRLQAKIDDLYDAANVAGFLRAFANATSFASRGTGVDYAPVFDGAEVGITANLAAAVDGLEEGQDPAAGLAPNLSLVGGLNLGRWGHPELTLYGNGFYRGASFDQLEGSITNAGVHAQYHLWPASDTSPLVFQWSGLHLTGGVEWSRWSFSAGDSLTRDFTLAGDNGVSTDVTAAGVGRFDLNATSTVVPLEATTSVRILYFASAYVGGGVDFQVGSADADIAVSGQMTGVRPSDGAAVDIGSATVTARGDGRPSRVAYHLLLGAEANLWRIKLVVQGSFVPFDGATVGLGLRVRL